MVLGSRPSRSFAVGVLLLLLATAVLVLVLPGPLVAQEAGWAAEGELGAAVFFGNRSQVTLTTRGQVERADSARELSLTALYNYGQATGDDGDTFVSARSWKVAGAFDHRPWALVSPFVFGEMESALERQIELRYNLGAGGKLQLRRTDRSRADVSAALLAERTQPRPEAGVEGDAELLARWSVRLRARRTWGDDHLSFTTENFWRPKFGEVSDFTFSSTSSLGLRLSEIVTLKLSLVDNYDSGAEDRGALSNNDGRFFVSLLSTFF